MKLPGLGKIERWRLFYGCFQMFVDAEGVCGNPLTFNILPGADMRNIRARIEKLETREPEDIILKLRDGTHFHYPGPALSFFSEGLDDIRENRTTPLLKAIRETVSAEGCGRIWEVLLALAYSPVSQTEGVKE